MSNTKIEGIVSEIGKLTLLETADLIKELKVRHDLDSIDCSFQYCGFAPRLAYR